MSKIPRLSIITVNLNNRDGLQKTLQSVLSQNCSDYEFIIIDGGSTDGSQEILEVYKKSLNFCVSEPDGGIYQAMNKGIMQAKGEYCLFLNSGDWLNEDVLPRAVRECTGEDIIYFDTYLSYDDARFEVLRYPPALTMRNFYKRTIGHQSTLIKTNLFQRFGLYNEEFKVHSDYEFWLNSIILNNCSCKHVEIFLTYYDMDGRSSKVTKSSEEEINSILHQSIPPRIIKDYEYWSAKESDMQILSWYRNKKSLYAILVLLFKTARVISRITK